TLTPDTGSSDNPPPGPATPQPKPPPSSGLDIKGCHERTSASDRPARRSTTHPPMGELFVKRAWGTGPVACCGRRAGDCLLAFLAGAVFRAVARVRGQAGAPAALAPVRARARTNELEAGQRRPMIGSEEGRLAVAGCQGVCV